MKEEHLEHEAPRSWFSDAILGHLDIIAVVAALLLMGLHLAGYFLPLNSGAGAASGELSRATDSLREVVVERKFDMTARSNEWKSQLAAGQAMSAPVAAYPDSLEALIARPRELVGTNTNTVVLPAAADLRADAERGAVRLRWIAHPDTTVVIGNWKIFRAVGNQAFSLRATTPNSDSLFLDTEVGAGVTYSYRVQPIPADPEILAKLPEGPVSEPVSVQAEADRKLTLKAVASDRSSATFQVEKWHDEAWRTKLFDVAVGAEVGEVDSGTDVDYRTHQKVLAIEMREEVRKTPRLDVVFDAQGRVLVHADQPVTQERIVEEKIRIFEVALEGPAHPKQVLTLEVAP